MLTHPDLSTWSYLFLIAAGLVSGTVDAIAGGGGLITVPALLAVGLPVPQVLGSNKLGVTFGTSAATWSFAKRGVVDIKSCWLGIGYTFAGALAGAYLVRLLDPIFLGRLIPWLLGIIVLYMMFRPQLGEKDRHHRLEAPVYYALFGLGLGFYDGFFGPGVGSFWTISFVMILGHNFVKATAHAKVMNLASNTAALIMFAFGGVVLLGPGLALGAGQLVGGRLGALLAMTRGARFVRPVFLVMAGLTVLKLLYSHYFQN
jgi:hypothetical protein